jgi:hypothetical protein
VIMLQGEEGGSGGKEKGKKEERREKEDKWRKTIDVVLAIILSCPISRSCCSPQV